MFHLIWEWVTGINPFVLFVYKKHRSKFNILRLHIYALLFLPSIMFFVLSSKQHLCKAMLTVFWFCIASSLAEAQKPDMVIILKMDDLEYKNPSFVQNWERYMDTIRSYRINSGLGVIMDHIAEAPQPFKDSLAAWHLGPFFELWHHGWDHTRLNYPPDLTNKGEFSGTPYEYQKAHFENTISFAHEELGVQLRTFGAPYNQTDEVFARVISESESIKVWMYCKDPSYAGLCLLRGHSNMLESQTGVVSFESFLTGYKANTNPYLVLQGHPGKWDDSSFQAFEKVINYLKDRNHTFMLPYDYYLHREASR